MNKYEGIMLVNKPSGMTSHDVVDFVRKRLQMRRIGHAGTLDPLAEGLLIILVGSYTKKFSKFADYDKEYIAIVRLGEATDTGDAGGKIIKKCDYQHITHSMIHNVVKSFEGEIEQVPPMVSALHHNGKRLYRLAKKGIVVERKPRRVFIHKIDILEINIPSIYLYIKCSKGTYIRKLAEDIGGKLNSCAYIERIKRIGVGPFSLEEAVAIDEINPDSIKKISF